MGDETQAEAWAILGGGDSAAQRLRDEFAEAAGVSASASPGTQAAAPGAASTALAAADIAAAVERKPDEIEWLQITEALCTEVCTVADTTGSLMLHRLAAKRAPLKTIQAALDAFPEALHERTAAGNLAYDLAVSAGAEPAVVDKLFIGHLQAMGELDELRSLLRNEGGDRGLSQQAQVILADAAKSRARLCEIDSAEAKRLGLSIVDRRLLGELIETSNNLARVRHKLATTAEDSKADDGPELPLELALKHQAPGVVVTRLLEEQPMAHGTKVEGHLPLHWAVKHQASHEVVEKLLASQPGSAATKTQAYHLPAGKAPAYCDRAGHGVGGQHVGGWPSVECRRSLQHGEHLRPFARWPPDGDDNSAEPVASTGTPCESKPTEGTRISATVRLAFNDGPMGVKWTLPRSCDEPFRLAYVALGMPAAKGGLTVGMELLEINGQSVHAMRRVQGVGRDEIVDKMVKTRPLTLTMREPQLDEARETEAGGDAMPTDDAVGFPDRKDPETWRRPCPHALRKTRTAGYLPLHLAVSSGADSGVVEALLDEYPLAIRETDPRGNLPLHLAAKNCASGDVVHRLLYAYPDAAWTTTDWQNSYPLHLAAEHSAPVEAVNLLIQVYPDAAHIARHGGEYPLHLAAANNAELAVVKALDAAAPEVVRLENDAGNLPLHLAVERSAKEQTLNFLLQQNPEAWKRYNKFSSRAEMRGEEPLRKPGE